MKFFVSCLRFLPPELAHSVALNGLNLIYKIGLINFLFPMPQKVKSFNYKNLTFMNQLGLAAGLDKNGDFIDALGALGFGFIEVGTVTPLAQPGNSKPRIFRFLSKQAIINRLGFNNKGVDHLVAQIKTRKYKGILGVNIGSNKNSEGQKRINDYIECFEKVAPFSDYITINISSPNTPNLRALHSQENLLPLFEALSIARQKLSYSNPIFIKLSPDESTETISLIMEEIRNYNFDGVISSNTTIDKTLLKDSDAQGLVGGLSGKPLYEKSNALLSDLHSLDPNILKIGVGGVFTQEDFAKKINLGASLVQIYTSFIYEGPQIVSKLLK